MRRFRPGLFLADILIRGGLSPWSVQRCHHRARRRSQPSPRRSSPTPGCAALSFTGSTRVGRALGEMAARHLTPAVLELGGKNSVIVLDDADLDYAVDAVAFAAYMNSGQICMSADRVIAQRAVLDELASRLADKGGQAGRPVTPATRAH